MTNRLCAWLPLLGLINLSIALGAYWVNDADNIALYILAGATMLAGIPILIRWQFGKRGLRSVKDLGFVRNRDAWFYAAYSMRGYQWKPTAVVLAAFGTMMLTGLASKPPTASALLAFATAWAVGAVAHFTRRWPGDSATPS